MSRLSKVIVMLVVGVALTLIASWVKADWEAWLDKPLVIEEPEERHVVVRPGDTLWQIARREYSGAHTGKMVSEILAVNPEIGRDCVIRPGQKVRLP